MNGNRNFNRGCLWGCCGVVFLVLGAVTCWAADLHKWEGVWRLSNSATETAILSVRDGDSVLFSASVPPGGSVSWNFLDGVAVNGVLSVVPHVVSEAHHLKEFLLRVEFERGGVFVARDDVVVARMAKLYMVVEWGENFEHRYREFGGGVFRVVGRSWVLDVGMTRVGGDGWTEDALRAAEDGLQRLENAERRGFLENAGNVPERDGGFWRPFLRVPVRNAQGQVQVQSVQMFSFDPTERMPALFAWFRRLCLMALCGLFWWAAHKSIATYEALAFQFPQTLNTGVFGLPVYAATVATGLATLGALLVGMVDGHGFFAFQFWESPGEIAGMQDRVMVGGGRGITFLQSVNQSLWMFNAIFPVVEGLALLASFVVFWFTRRNLVRTVAWLKAYMVAK